MPKMFSRPIRPLFHAKPLSTKKPAPPLSKVLAASGGVMVAQLNCHGMTGLLVDTIHGVPSKMVVPTEKLKKPLMRGAPLSVQGIQTMLSNHSDGSTLVPFPC